MNLNPKKCTFIVGNGFNNFILYNLKRKENENNQPNKELLKTIENLENICKLWESFNRIFKDLEIKLKDKFQIQTNINSEDMFFLIEEIMNFLFYISSKNKCIEDIKKIFQDFIQNNIYNIVEKFLTLELENFYKTLKKFVYIV